MRSGCVGLELDPTLKIRDTSSSFCETFSSQVNDADLFVCICEPRVVYLRVSFSIVLLQIESYISLKKGVFILFLMEFVTCGRLDGVLV